MHLLATLARTGGSLPERRHAEQIKGRNFEVPGCGGFLLTGQAENLADYYRPGEEVACFADRADLVRQVRYYLYHEAERARIAAAGHRRTLAEHTYVHRLTAIFERMGLPSPPASALLDAPPRPGNVQEVA